MSGQHTRMSFKKDVVMNIKLNQSTFEEAIAATGFGKFNVLLMLLIITTTLSVSFETATMSYVFPIAQCDLQLSLSDKGMLNSATYIGMTLSSFFWGIISDKYGRKKVLVTGTLLNVLIVLICSFSRKFVFILVLKFFGGLLITGPSTSMTPYLSELHAIKHRSRILLSIGFLHAAGTLLLPSLASVILPSNIKISLFGDFIVLKSWNIFILVSSLAPLISGLGFLLMPESPKFYMSKGQNERAMEVFRKIYCINTGRPKEDFPIKELIQESSTITTKKPLNENVPSISNSLWDIFKAPYLKYLVLLCYMQTSYLMSLNTIRLWMPQFFQAIHEYKAVHNRTSVAFCTILESLKSNEELIATQTCSVNTENNIGVYLNSMIIGLVSMILFTITMVFINMINRKKFLIFCGTTAGILLSCVFLSQNMETTLALVSLTLSLTNVSFNTLITIVVVIFPTSMRTQAFATTAVLTRLGSFIGNLVFPFVLQMGCLPPFLIVGGIIMASSIFSILLPNTDGKTIT